MPPRSAGRRSQTQLPIEALKASASAEPSTGSPAREGYRVRQPTRHESRADGGDVKPAASPRSRATSRPVQPVPRLLLSRKEAAASLGMSLDTFERRVQPVIRLVPCGQLVLVPLREIERWCEDHAHYMAGTA